MVGGTAAWLTGPTGGGLGCLPGAGGGRAEIDAIGPISSGTGGVVNELLVQLQSFDTQPLAERTAGRLIDWLNGWLPATAQLAKRPPATTTSW
jgi:hypothetical protein